MKATVKVDDLEQTAAGLYVLECGAHDQCETWSFEFELTEWDESSWTVVAAGSNGPAAYEVAHRYMVDHCVNDLPFQMVEQDRGEPGPLAIYGWNDARTGCLLPAWEEE
ncbi:hypothetical protein [Streptomyces sp. NPDC059994]|uniref:hypothetical protein n=1 Tax=Streptomyces sp. NPDC059994 TaxID=3347029 RepID=UPI0036CA13F5